MASLKSKQQLFLEGKDAMFVAQRKSLSNRALFISAKGLAANFSPVSLLARTSHGQEKLFPGFVRWRFFSRLKAFPLLILRGILKATKVKL